LKRLEGKTLQRHGNGKGTYYTRLKPVKPESGADLLSNNISVRQACFINGMKKKEVANFTRTDYEEAVSVSSRTANRDLGELVESGYLRIFGKGKNARYSLRNWGNGAIPPCGANRSGCGANDMARM
jgi:predicted HTH transcriptional regulator